ncbi:MAG: class I SAM-dependent methyltransferase [Herpetosiphon sp.]
MEAIEYDVMAAVEGQHWWYSGMRALAAAWLDPLFQRNGDAAILDAGCGTGGNVEFLRRYGQTTGIDLLALATDRARLRAPSRIARGSVVDLPFMSAHFDLVTSFEVLYHRGVIDVTQAVHEMWRVLRPGGYTLVRLPAYNWLNNAAHSVAVHARERYVIAQVQEMLSRSGFRILRASYCNSILLPLALAQRISEPLHKRPTNHSDLEPPDPVVNRGLRTVLELEAAALRRGAYFPWGLSILVLAQRPTDGRSTTNVAGAYVATHA